MANQKIDQYSVGDVVAELSVSASAPKFFLLARSTLNRLSCQEVSVSFSRPKRLFGSISFSAITATERKQADDQLSALCDQLQPREIALAERVHEAAWKWLSQKHAAPPFDDEVSTGRVHGIFIGKATEALEAVGSMADTDTIRRISIGAVYLTGRPPSPHLRFLPEIEEAKSTEYAIKDLSTWSANLTDTTRSGILAAVDSTRAYYEKGIERRRTMLRDAALKALGRERGERWLTQQREYSGAPIENLAYADFRKSLAYLERVRAAPLQTKRNGRIRAWRATE